jgi:alpha-tubulin suppressor-like RCC1 family protein
MPGLGSLNARFACRLAAVVVGLAVIAGPLVTTTGPASAKVVKAKITRMAASPSSITDNDGTVTISASVANASTCTLSSKLPVQGLPVTVSCTSGTFSENVILPYNSVHRALRYKLSLTATGTTTVSKKVKVKVATGAGRPPLSGVKSVIGSNEYEAQSLPTYCAILETGGVDCWGDNQYGELGIGTATGPDTCGSANCSKTPRQVLGAGGSGLLSGVKALATSGDVSSFCALIQDGSVDCWGSNYLGALGIGTDSGPSQCNGEPCSTVPEQVPITNVVSLTGGYYDYCATLQGGGVDCWGYGAVGERGDGPAFESDIPTYNIDSPDSVLTGPDTALSGAASVVWSDLSTFCALMTSGGVDCWGWSADGILGNGTSDGPDVCGGGDTCAMYAAPVLGVDGSGLLSGVVQLAAGTTHFCAVLSSGGVVCWGSDREGQLGDGGADDATSPVVVEGVGGSGVLTGATALVILPEVGTGLDADTTCALIGSGSADCWGSDNLGQLGDATSSPSSVPEVVLDTAGTSPLSGVETVFGNLNTVCASLTSGLDCWGSDSQGNLGAGLNPVCVAGPSGCSTPATVLGIDGKGTLSGVESMASNTNSACAVLTSSDVACWGSDSEGELGDGALLSEGQSSWNSPESVFAPA